MLVNYIEKDGVKLFSFHRHDFQMFETGEFIDGGFDYIRTNTEVKSGEIKDLIEDIRKQFTLSTESFPISLLTLRLIKLYLQKYIKFSKSTQYSIMTIEILASELLYRNANKKRKTKVV